MLATIYSLVCPSRVHGVELCGTLWAVSFPSVLKRTGDLDREVTVAVTGRGVFSQ